MSRNPSAPSPEPRSDPFDSAQGRPERESRGDNTIVAVATPLGQGGLGVVRLSGPRAVDIVQSLFRSDHFKTASSHTLHHGVLENEQSVIDEVVVGLFRSPRSYTGEDVVEISCHGGPVILREILEACQARGAHLAGPGEFTKRAYLNGKMDLAQAEAVADLISSRSKVAKRLALEQLRGGLRAALGPLKNSLIDLLAGLEANLDFVEEDIPPVPPNELKSRLSSLLEQAERLIAGARSGRLLREGARLVLLGKPNAGKSSLFNRLVNFDRSIVTDVPGTTRDTIEETIEVGGYGVVLVDTAGWRATSDPVETEGVARTRSALENSDGALFVMDSSQALQEEDKRIARELQSKPLVAVLNKSDLPPALGSGEALSLFKEAGKPLVPAVSVSSKTGQGVEELKSLLPRVFCPGGREVQETPMITGVRHLSLLVRFRDALRSADTALSRSLSEECASLELKRALQILGEITGENVEDSVLERVFSKFCIGK